jgi:hypothetical protein
MSLVLSYSTKAAFFGVCSHLPRLFPLTPFDGKHTSTSQTLNLASKVNYLKCGPEIQWREAPSRDGLGRSS